MTEADLNQEQARSLLHQMLRIRRFEEKAAELYTKEKIRGFLHLYIGEEAVAAGIMAALSPQDPVVSNYREHGHALARGIPASSLMAEMYGRANGCARGRGGSMHLFDRSREFYGGYAIVGGGLPVAVGLALAAKLQAQPRVIACIFGDGATDEGEFHESLNLAALWRLPLLLLCENNLYAMGIPFARHSAGPELIAKPRAYGIPAEKVDGMDVLAVTRACKRAADAARAGSGPMFLELSTYRFRAHSMYDPERYRSKEEVAQWRSRDPILLWTNALRAQGALNDAELAQLERDVAAELEGAIMDAERGALEPASEIERYVYAEVQR